MEEETRVTRHVDVIVMAIKSYDTAECITELEAIKDNLPPILCLQNGVDNETLLAEAFGLERVIAGTLTTAVSKNNYGEVIVERARGMGLVEGHPLSCSLAAALGASGFMTKLYRNTLAMKWSKLLTNLLTNAACAICDLPPRQILEHDGLYQTEIAALREALDVMKRMSIPVVDLPRTSARALSFAARHLHPSIYRTFLTKQVDTGRGDKMPSFHIDLLSGRNRSEVSFLNGAVSKHGEAIAVNTPVNRRLTEILTAITQGRMEWDTYRYHPDKLADKLIG